MKIHFIQKLIDKIRFDIILNVNVKLNPFQEEVINRIKEYQKSIKFPSFENKQEFTDFEWIRMPYHSQDILGAIAIKDDKIYRLVYPSAAKNFIELYETGILQAFGDYGIMPKIKITNYQTKDFPIIFETEKVNMVRSCFWSYYHVKEDAKLKLQMIEILKEFGYGLTDGHLINTAFVNNKPMFIDFGSIIKNTSNEGSMQEIFAYNLLPLIMMSLKDCFFSRYLLVYNFRNFILPGKNFDESFEAKSVIKEFTNAKNYLIMKRITKLKIIKSEDIDRLFDNEKYKTETMWGNYCPNLENYKDITLDGRYGKVIDAIKKYSPNAKSSIDLAGNCGLFSYMIKKFTNIQRAISTDYDSMAVEYGIKTIKEFQPEMYVLNFMKNIIPEDLIETQMKQDIVTALAVTHHLILTQNYNIDYIFEVLKKYTKKHVYVEFCPMGMYAGYMEQLPEVPDWYTTDWFEEHFKKHFNLLHKEVVAKRTVNNKEYDHRILFVGEVQKQFE